MNYNKEYYRLIQKEIDYSMNTGGNADTDKIARKLESRDRSLARDLNRIPYIDASDAVNISMQAVYKLLYEGGKGTAVKFRGKDGHTHVVINTGNVHRHGKKRMRVIQDDSLQHKKTMNQMKDAVRMKLLRNDIEREKKRRMLKRRSRQAVKDGRRQDRKSPEMETSFFAAVRNRMRKYPGKSAKAAAIEIFNSMYFTQKQELMQGLMQSGYDNPDAFERKLNAIQRQVDRELSLAR